MSFIENKRWIENHLASLPFVEWDRFTLSEWRDGEQTVSVYGWIERDDEYKDFVVVLFWPEIEEFYFTTSSTDRTRDIYRALVGGDLSDHDGCMRVERHFSGYNQSTLADSSYYNEIDGG